MPDPEVEKEILRGKSGPAVLQAVQWLLEHDRYLLEVDANERSISHRLAMYLQSMFRGLHVDCEYNRDDTEPKELDFPGPGPDARDSDARTVFPDIIVHRRGVAGPNVLVIEIKKTNRAEDSAFDLMKLRLYREQLGYEEALFVEFGVGNSAGLVRAEWIGE